MTKPNFKVLQKIYQSVKIPKELPYEVNKAIKKTKKKRLSLATRTTIKVCTTLVTCFIIFMVMVNVNPNFVAAGRSGRKYTCFVSSSKMVTN